MKTQETIQWRSWCAEVFKDAQQAGKPIFLSISATWCHWCHVLDEESFTHPEVIRRLNADFIPVRVDSDKRPDVNSRYNMGGWPTVVILDSQGKVVTGGTYMPTGQLLSMLSLFQKGKQKSSKSTLHQSGKVSQQPPTIDETAVETVARFLERAFDRDFGGFGGPPKFPQIWAIDLIFHLHARTGEKKWLEMATLTLDNMREGELYDPIDGGFFRYSASNDWDSPHYEKLLELNAQMLSLYLKAYCLTGQITYRATAQGVLDYLFSTLAKAPASSSAEAMLQALPEHGGRGACEDLPKANRSGPTSNSEPGCEDQGQVWFYGSQSADRDYYRQSETERLWAKVPPLDPTLYTDRNAIAASALIKSYHVLDAAKYCDRALKLIDFLWEHCYQPEHGMFHYEEPGCGNAGQLFLLGYLSDQVHMINALMDAFEATGVEAYLNRAETLATVIEHHLWDHGEGGYWDLPASSETLETLKVRIKPFTENAVASMALTRLFHLTGRQVYEDRSKAVLTSLSTVFLPYKHHAAPFGLAVERFLHPPHHVTLVGHREDSRWGELLKAAHQLRTPWKVVLPLNVEQDMERLKSLGYPPSSEPLAYLCVGKACFPPVSRPEDLVRVITGYMP